MLSKNESKVMELLFSDIGKEESILSLSRALKQKYPQTYNTVMHLKEKGLLNIKKSGNSNIPMLDFSKFHIEYAEIEAARRESLKNRTMGIIAEKISSLNKQFVCILFGSYASKKQISKSDIDLLFIIPEEYDIKNFEKIISNKLSLYKADINIITEKSLFEMWSRPMEFNVGNEILKNHLVLFGAEYFISLLKRKYYG
jgi:predicted nucleotidyltransferase